MIWLGPEQLEQLGVSRGILLRSKANWTSRETGRRGRNGKMIREYLLESMSAEWQRKWLAMQPTLEVPIIDNESPADIPPPADEGPDAVVDDSDAEARLTQALARYRPELRSELLIEAQRLASIIERYDAIKPKRRQRPGGGFEYVPEVLRICEETPCTNQAILAIEPSRSDAKSPHTLEALSKRYRTERLAAFLRKPPERRAAVDRREAQISAEAIDWINANFRKMPSAERLFKECKKHAQRRGWTIPARGWFYRKYEAIPTITRTLLYEGQKAYTSRYAPYVPRDYRDLAALQIICGDHSVRDVTVMLPDGSLTRPWLTLWQDLRTGLIWGWHLDLTPSSTTIGLAYANGVKTFGAQPPSSPQNDFYSYLYTDQGKDYRCKAIAGHTLEFGKAAAIEGGLNALCTQRRVGLIDELGLKHLMARGYNAREKFIERTHKDISEWEKNTFEYEYCGRGVGHKPERWQKAWARHQKLLKRVGKNLDWLAAESDFMTLDDYRENLSGWINEYNHAEHTRSVLGGATIVPVQEYERLYTTRFEISEEMLAMLLMRAGRRKIGKNGVQFHQPSWFYLHEAMSDFKGQEIEVRYSDGDWDRIFCVLPNGKIVEAERVTASGILNPNKQTMGQVARQRAYEMRTAREYNLIQQSNWRGESVEDRVQAQLGEPEPEPPEQEKIAVNARVPIIGRFDQFDRNAGRGEISLDDVAGANVIEGMFGSDRPSRSRIKEEWED